MATTMRRTRQKSERLKRLTWLNETQVALGWGVILILIALLGAIYLNQASRIASVGRRVQVLQSELENIKRDNAALARQIAEVQSLERLQREAIRLGFVPARPADIEYIIVPDYPIAPGPAIGDSAPDASVIESDPPETMREAVWLAFKSGISSLIYGEASEQ